MSMPAVGSSLWIEAEVRRYLTRGDYDNFFVGWPGHTVVDIATGATQRLRAALVETTLRRASGFERSAPLPELIDPWLRDKLSPMVHGLFTEHERDCVLDALARGIVFLAPLNIVGVLATEPWLSTAWRVANLYLDSLGAQRLGSQAGELVGLSQNATCYVSLAYFDQTDPFADYVVHEAAHVLHNCRRTAIGLPEHRHCPTPLSLSERPLPTRVRPTAGFSRWRRMASPDRRRSNGTRRRSCRRMSGSIMEHTWRSWRRQFARAMAGVASRSGVRRSNGFRRVLNLGSARCRARCPGIRCEQARARIAFRIGAVRHESGHVASPRFPARRR